MGWDGAVLRAEIGAEFDTLAFRREDVLAATATWVEYKAQAARERVRRCIARKKRLLGTERWRAQKRQVDARYRARRRADPSRYLASLATARAWKARNKAAVAAQNRAWWAANRERVNQHRRDERARLKASRAERTV
jgi:ElaB/YqjD/DUF883 family membrane-anchored ribosome-binding protein